MTTAFVYKWTHLPSLKWYIGSRTSRNCHPGDNYLCSSKIVKPLIQEHPEEWKRDIIETGSPQEMRDLEYEILCLFDAKNDPRSFNRHNSKMSFPDTPWNKGKKTGPNPKHSEFMKKQTPWNKGLKATAEAIANQKAALRRPPLLTLEQIAMRKGRTPWNKGVPHTQEHKDALKEAWVLRKKHPQDRFDGDVGGTYPGKFRTYPQVA